MNPEGRGEREKVRLPLLATGASWPVDRWIVEALGAQPPAETTATCDDCVMLPEAGARLDGAEYFDPSVRCCTYTPALANFLVGAVLGDDASPGRASVVARVRASSGVTPLGLGVTASNEQDYARSLAAGTFGRDPALRCPHHADGGCSIWPYRNATCRTWYCKHDRGARGMAFWQRGIEPMLRCVERSLARHCALALDIPAETLLGLEGPRSTASVERDEASLPWGPWEGRREDFFAACTAQVATLSWSDVRSIGGAELALRVRVARHLQGALDAPLPTHPRQGRFEVTALREGVARVVTYSRFDALELPFEMLAALAHHDGRSLEDARRACRELGAPALDDELVGMLADFGLLQG